MRNWPLPSLLGGALAGLLAFGLLHVSGTPVPHWQRAADSAAEHVMSLGWAEAGQRLYAGTQSGRLLVASTTEDWVPTAGLPGGITRLLGTAPVLAGTTSGLFHVDDDGARAVAPALFDGRRISDLAETADDILVAAEHGIFRAATAGDWESIDLEGLPAAPIYRLAATAVSKGEALHAGLIGAGVWTRIGAEDGTATAWLANDRGLPPGSKVLALQGLADGGLLAGTDQGLYRQAAPFHDWQPLGRALAGQRVLALALEPAAGRLWAGTDHGVYTSADGLDGTAPHGPDWRLLPAQQPFPAAVSHIVVSPLGVHVAAGDIYHLATRRPLDLAHLLVALLLAAVVTALLRRRLGGGGAPTDR